MSVLQSFRRDRRGNVAVIFALAAIPILGATGVAIDYGRSAMAQARLTDILDAAVLAVGSKPAMADDAAKTMVTDWVNSQLGNSATIQNWQITSFTQASGKITVTASATVPTTITKLLGFDTMPISTLSEAIRSINKLEVALVLDTTSSMNNPSTKMSGLRTAATNLVTKITADPKADVKIAVIPYDNYVNIGVANRNQPWVRVPADYSTSSCVTSATVCDTSTTTTTSCVKYNDGIPYTTTCSTSTCTASHVVTYNPPKCTTTNYKFNGCLGSPAYPDNVRDDNPSRVYPGIMNATCTSQLVPLTNDVTAVKAKITALTAVTAYTYLPSGLAWGFNALSPDVPLTEAAAYDSTGRNLNPTKALVLMTDGFNTVTRNTTTSITSLNFGKHDQVASPKIATQANTWTAELCTNIKAKNIKVYTVAYQVDNTLVGAPEAKAMLQACATDANSYFDATDSTALIAAFGQIAEDMNNLRLTR